MNKKSFILVLIAISVFSFVLNLFFTSLFETESLRMANRLAGLEFSRSIISLQNTSLLIFIFITFYFTINLKQALKYLAQSSVYTSLLFTLLLTFFLFIPNLFILSGVYSYDYAMIVNLFRLALIISICAILVYYFSKSSEIITNLIGLIKFTIKYSLFVAFSQLIIIGVLISVLNMPIESHKIWPTNAAFFNDLMIQPFILLLSFSLGIYMLNRFNNVDQSLHS